MTARRQAARREAMLDGAVASYMQAEARVAEAVRAVRDAAWDTTSDSYWNARLVEMEANDHLRVADAWRLRCQAQLDELMEAVR